VEMILPSPPARAISFPLVRTTTLGQSVYPDIALHISNYYININHTMYFLTTVWYRNGNFVMIYIRLTYMYN